MQRRHEKPKTRIPLTTRVLVEDRIKQDWSPEQISGRLFMEQGVSISHEWIYLPIYRDKHQGGDLHKHLRCQKRNGASVMASRIAGDASPTASALMTAPLSQTINPASVTGKAIPSSARVTGASSPLLWNAKQNTPFWPHRKPNRPGRYANALNRDSRLFATECAPSLMTMAWSLPSINKWLKHSLPKYTSPTPMRPGRGA